MFLINKVSKRYNAQQDRLEFAIQNESSEVISLWVTQRIANRLARVLMDHVNVDFSATSQDKNQHAQKADDLKKEQQSVPFDASKESGLVHTFNLSFKRNATEIVFRWGVTGHASIALNQHQLEDFCKGLAQLFAAAQWPKDIFPQELIVTLASKPSTFGDFDETLEAVLTTKSLH